MDGGVCEGVRGGRMWDKSGVWFYDQLLVGVYFENKL